MKKMKKKLLALVLCMLFAVQPILTVEAEVPALGNEEIGTKEDTIDTTEVKEENEENFEPENESEVKDDQDTVPTEGEKKEKTVLEEPETGNVLNEEEIPERSGLSEDTEKPVLYPDTLTIDNVEANVGDIINFGVKVEDNVGLDRVIIEWKNLDNNSFITWKTMTYNMVTEKYEYSLKIEESMTAGHWIIDSVGAYDISGNYKFLSYGIDNKYGGTWDFYIKNDSIDSESPSIEKSSIRISKHEAKVGDDIVISVKAYDNIGITRINVDICKSEEIIGKQYNMTYNEDTGFYEYTFKPDQTNVGRYYIGSVYAYDAAGNSSSVKFSKYDVDAIWIIITDEEFDYDCEVINLQGVSGDNIEYSYSYNKYDNVRMRIFDDSVVGYIQQRISISNTTKEVDGVFIPYKSGKTTVEVYSINSNEILKVYTIEVVPKKYSTCIDKSVSGKFLSSVKQTYSVMYNNEKLDSVVKLLSYSESTVGTSTIRECEYGYELKFGEIGNRRVSIIGDADKKEIVVDIQTLEHDFSEEWTIDKETSCDKTGSKSHHCLRCDEKKDITEIPKIAHDYAKEWTVDKNPTCIEKGSKSHHCAICGEKGDIQEIEALGHDYTDWTLIQLPTYESDGLEIRTCSRCDSREERKVPKLEIIIPETPKVQIESLDSNNIKLWWKKVSGDVWYEIYRANVISGEYELLFNVSNSEEVITCTLGANTGIPYYYIVRAANYQNGNLIHGKFSNIVEGKAELSILSGLTAKPAGVNKVSLSWDSVPEAKGYLIYAQKDGKYGYCGMTTRGTTFTDLKALDTDYNFYWVFPYVEDENGKMYPGKCEKYVFAKGVTLAVTDLKAVSQKGSVKLTWTASKGAEGYLIYGKTETGNYGYIGMTTLGTTYTDKKASNKEYNFYWVYPYHKDKSGKMIVGGTPKYVYGKAK